mgnify:CR=1 FL=1
MRALRNAWRALCATPMIATFVVAVVVLAATGALAGWLPASRAARIDPARVLGNQ